MRTFEFMFTTGICWMPAEDKYHAFALGHLLADEDNSFGKFIGAIERGVYRSNHGMFVAREIVEECA